MSSQEIATVHFVDLDTGEQALAIVRVIGTQIALCLSREHDGDMEVFFKAEDCRILVEKLQQAIDAIQAQ